jgi:branched-chain amino acid transport system permease protein
MIPGFYLVIDSMVLAGIYTLLSLGWVIVYRATGLLNFAHGQFLMVGAYLYYALVVQAGIPWGWALPAALLAGAALSAAAYAGLLKPVTGQPLFSQVVLTMGLAIVMTSIVSMIWGPTAKPLPMPFHNEVYHLISGATITRIELAVTLTTVACVVVLLLLLGRTRLGVRMRAAAESPLLASQSGVSVPMIAAVSWSLAGVLITFGGIAYAQQSLVSPTLGDLGLRGIAPALLGGLDSIPGAIVGSIVVALVQNLGEFWFGGGAADVAAYLVILAVLAVRPTGFFGTREVRRI